MPDLQDGESVEVQGSARLPYILKNTGGVYSCSCPAWRHQSLPIEQRTCKHLIAHRSEAAERQRLGTLSTPPSTSVPTRNLALPLLLAETWDGEQDVTGWFLSEKLDGVRALWDGTGFRSRNGNLYHAPAWFTAGLPNMPLDGELWSGRKQFQRTVSIVRRHDGSDLWRKIKFLVFDAPAVPEPFEQRLSHVQQLFIQSPSQYFSLLEQQPCRNRHFLNQQLEQVLSLGGEGLMLRQPGSLYESGRSSTLLKVKRFLDAEAKVIDYLPGTGRHKGRLGAVLVELPSGIQFSVGSGFTDTERKTPPAIGSTITFRYQELSERGVPRFPTFVRVRSDLT